MVGGTAGVLEEDRQTEKNRHSTPSKSISSMSLNHPSKIDRHELAAANASMLVRVGSTIGYLAIDGNKKAIVVRWPAAMAYGIEAMASCSEQLRIFSNTSASKPPEVADSHRHACLVRSKAMYVATPLLSAAEAIAASLRVS
ncbi:hypothetical protein HO133_004800 [Letharia lupina]|uniref:Uncharacterized protein n=1 Tax=Letharia lupina TaxID=560253 RepID=A0A8H6FL23_9LECA|nr:uncharacterized protein HO133_004800 [Letharia lupina]KAF6230457.1 hypothetical protein HO133_004800 [Letharia lupina]